MKFWMIPLFTITLLFTPAFTAQALAGDDVQLGVFLQELNDELRAKFDYDGEGILVTGIVEGSGAEKAGMQKGEIIVVFNGEMIASTADLIEAIRETRVGEKVKIIAISDGKAKKYNVVMGARKDVEEPKKEIRKEHKEPKEQKEPKKYKDALKDTIKKFTPGVQKYMYVYPGDRSYLGIQMLELTDQLARFFEVKHGVLVASVVEDGPAEKAGLKAGDVIVTMGEEKIMNGDGLLDVLSNREEGDKVELVYVRRGDKETTKVKLGKLKKSDFDVEGYMFGDPEGDMEFYAPPVPPMPPVIPDYDFEDFRKGMEKYRAEMEKMRDELKRLREDLKELKRNR